MCTMQADRALIGTRRRKGPGFDAGEVKGLASVRSERALISRLLDPSTSLAARLETAPGVLLCRASRLPSLDPGLKTWVIFFLKIGGQHAEGKCKKIKPGVLCTGFHVFDLS